MQFEKNQKNVKKWKIIFPLLILIVASGLFFILRPKKVLNQNEICNINFEQYEMEKEDYIIQDYFYYGDILNLKQEKYIPSKADDTTQKTLILKNICSKKETSVLLEKFIDRQLDLSTLEEGTYQLILSDKLVRKNIVSDIVFEPLTTITKNNTHLEITYLKLKDNYVFINVAKKESPSDKIDIVVDTPYYHKDLLNGLETGAGDVNAFSFQTATQFVEQLNNAGYRAKLARKQEEVKNVYDIDGRLDNLYQNKIKYYFLITAGNSENKNISGIYIENSFLASKNLPNKIMYAILENSDAKITKTLNVNEYGVVRGEAYKGLEQNYLYDGNLYIRESGGKATGAATFSDNSKRNEKFALNNLFGTYTINFNIGYISNEEDMKIIEQSNLADLFVKGFKK